MIWTYADLLFHKQIHFSGFSISSHAIHEELFLVIICKVSLKHCRSVCSGQALVSVFLNEINVFLFPGDCNSCLITEFRKLCYVVRDVLN